MIMYKVRAGDTLGKIARRFGVPVEAIIVMNRLANPDRLRVGQALEIPQATTDGMTTVTVRPEGPPRVASSGEPPINRTRFALPAKEFIGDVVDKDLIVLHFTAGQSARSAFDTWVANPVRVATAYIVEADGTIFETFHPSHWAFHLGVKDIAQEKRSIGIEMANVGPLRVSKTDPTVLNWWPSDFGKKWCRIDDTTRFVKASPFRGVDHFAVFPEEQMRAVAQLVAWLCDVFGIKKALPTAPRRMAFDPAFFAGFRGIAAHHNFRGDKWDTGPAFGWDRLGL
jgi:LysM repeat protein